MSDEKEMIHDLLELDFKNRCYISWVASGTIVGGLIIKPPALGVLVGFVAGLLWASYTCKPISKNVADSQRFISESDFQSFHKKINTYYPVSRDEAFALARLATTQSLGTNACSAPSNVSAQLEELFSVARK